MYAKKDMFFIMRFGRASSHTCHYSTIISHEFWVFLVLFITFSFTSCISNSSKIFAKRMGGKRIYWEPTTYAKWRKRMHIWEVMSKGVIDKFLEKLHGGNSQVTKLFLKNYNEGFLTMNGRKFHIIEEYISKVTSILIVKKKF